MRRRLGAAGPARPAAPGDAPGSASPGDADADTSAGALLRWIPSSTFPAERELLTATARARRAPDGLIDDLRRLPPAQVFQSVEQLAVALHAQARVRVDPEPDLVRARARS
ncbi:MAG TPA: DUF2795 domain-containing protein [Acidimicrobiales bacterium]